MSLDERIMNDYKQAMKDKDSAKSSTLSFLRAQLKYALIDKRVEKLSDEDAIAVIKKQVKQRQDSITQFEQGGRADLADKEKAELNLLKSYLPQEMSAEELNAVIEAAVKQTGAASMKDMGNVMKILLPQIGGRADSKLVSDLIKKRLA